jgi:GT2 family glycosyltransferase
MVQNKQAVAPDIQENDRIRTDGLTSTIPQSEIQLDASVIIVNYNGREHLTRCLESLEHTTYAEIIVVDNTSSDGSAEFVASTYPDVQLIRSQSNLGYGQGNNLGASKSQSRYLVFINPDTVAEPGWLESLVSALGANPRAGLATPKILLLEQPETINTCGNNLHLTGLTLCRGMSFPGSAFTQPARVSAISGAAFIIRRDLFEALGGFDPDFFLYMEDTDLSLRARLVGYHCLNVPDSVVYHDYALRFGPKKTFYQERNRYLMLLKNYRWLTLLVLSPALLLAEIVTWGFSLTRDRDHLHNKFKSYVWVIKNWGAIMARRHETQSLRNVRDRDLLLNTTHRLEYAQTGEGFLSRISSWIFDPLFYLLRGFALFLVWW